MKHLQTFNESIVEDKMQYLRDICNDFFDDYDGYKFYIINGKKEHSYEYATLFLNDESIPRVGSIKFPSDSNKYFFLYVRKIDNSVIKYSDSLLDLEKYLINVGFIYDFSYVGNYGFLLAFGKYSKGTQKYI